MTSHPLAPSDPRVDSNAAGAAPSERVHPSGEPEPPFPAQEMSPPGLESELDPAPRYRAEAYRGSGKLEGKVALITGGDSGIGRSVAVLFAREGANVAIVHLDEEQGDAEQVLADVEREGRRAISIPGDVRDPDFCTAAVGRCVEQLGGLNILVNNAAYQRHRDSLEEVTLEQWDETFRTNIYGYFHMVRAARPHLTRGDAIINTGSITGAEGNGRLLDYASSKGAIHAFTKSLAQKLAPEGIRANCVAPGPVWTPLNPAEREPDEHPEFGAGTPMGRPAQPEEVAPAFVFFASNTDSSYITGEVLTLLGGETTAG